MDPPLLRQCDDFWRPNFRTPRGTKRGVFLELGVEDIIMGIHVSPHCSSQLCIVSPSLFFTQLWTTRVGNGTSLEHRCGSAAGSFFPDVPTGCRNFDLKQLQDTRHGCQVKSFRYLFGDDNCHFSIIFPF